jgi:WD40 repeat protein
VTDPLEHRKPVEAAVFSSDGTRVVTASIETVRVWDARTGKLVTEPLVCDRPIAAVAFSPDGARVIIASRQRSAWIWDLPMDLGSLDDWRRRARCAPFALERSATVANHSSCP